MSVVCGETRLVDDGHFDTLLNPTLVVEVLSPSSEKYDAGEKFNHYQSIESLREYVLVSQVEPRVKRRFKKDNASDEWERQVASSIESSLELSSIKCRLSLAEVYSEVDFARVRQKLAAREASQQRRSGKMDE